MDDKIRYVFRTPLWRKLLPLFLGALAWLVPLSLDYVSRLPDTGTTITVTKSGVAWLARHGATVERAVMLAAGWCVLMLLWFHRELATLTVTPVSLIRKTPLLPGRELRWNDADEVLIDHTERLWEGNKTALRVLKVYAHRRMFDLWRRRMVVSNREFEGFHHVERLAVHISVPAIARRMLAEIDKRRRPVLFAQWQSGTGPRIVLYVLVAVAVLAAFALDSLWIDQARAPYRMYLPFVAGFLGLLVLRKLLVWQVGVDRHNVHVLLSGIVMRRVPIETITSMRANGNKLRIEARVGRDGKEKTVFSTGRFIRNRGVLLHLIRMIREQRRRHDETPIAPVRAAGHQRGKWGRSTLPAREEAREPTGATEAAPAPAEVEAVEAGAVAPQAETAAQEEPVSGAEAAVVPAGAPGTVDAEASPPPEPETASGTVADPAADAPDRAKDATDGAAKNE